MTTSSTNNSYTSNGYLYITPTLTSNMIGADAVLNGYTYNLTDCTYNSTNPMTNPGSSNTTSFDATAYYQACGAVSNSTTGAIINPIQSARITTRNKASIRYGRVEVRAKVPRGYALHFYDLIYRLTYIHFCSDWVSIVPPGQDRITY